MVAELPQSATELDSAIAWRRATARSSMSILLMTTRRLDSMTDSNDGAATAAKMPPIATTTSISISVKPLSAGPVLRNGVNTRVKANP